MVEAADSHQQREPVDNCQLPIVQWPLPSTRPMQSPAADNSAPKEMFEVAGSGVNSKFDELSQNIGLQSGGLGSAARWYVDEYGKRSQVKVSLRVDEPIERLPRDVEIALFRVLQETLTNVHRHAAAKVVDVQIVHRGGCVQLTVSDDGKGIPEDVLSKFRGGAAPGIGLAGMRERLAEFGGQIRVESSHTGSVVQAVIPTGPTVAHKRASGSAIQG